MHDIQIDRIYNDINGVFCGKYAVTWRGGRRGALGFCFAVMDDFGNLVVINP